jgi:hypothetical protein
MWAWFKDRTRSRARQGLPAARVRDKLRAVHRSATVFALAVVLSPQAAAQRPPRLELLDTAVLRAPRLIESSGIAPSRRVRGVFWTHNDRGDEPRLYATDSAGDDLGSVLVAGAANVDWEDLGSGSCPDHPGWCLYPADIGDNRRARDHIVVYRLAEPEPPRGPGDTLRRVPLESAVALRYPDRPHNAEAIAVEPSGRILIITKELLKPALVFRVPVRHAEQGPGEVDTLELVGPLDLVPSLARLRMVTGAAVSPDGTLLAVRTYSTLHLFRLRGDSLPFPITPTTGLTIPVVEPQGEGVAFIGPDRFVLTAERDDADHAIVSRLRIVGLAASKP